MIRGKREFKESTPVGNNKKARNGDSSLKNDNSSIIKRNVLVECSNNSYECQFEQLNLILKESTHSPTLTQNELRILFMKYKLDGNFEANKNFPFYTALLDNQQNRINYGDNLYNEARHTPIVDTQYLNCRGNKDTFDNLYYKKANGTQQIFKYSTYEHPENCTNEIYNYFPSGSANIENIVPKAHSGFEFQNNTSPYSAQYEHLQNINESSKQYNNTMEYFNQPWNLNISNDFHENDWDSNMSLPNSNNNYELWKNENSNSVPETNNSDWQYSVKNHLEPHLWNMHSPNTNYSPMNNKNLNPITTVNYDDHMHQDININTSTSSVPLNNFLDSMPFHLSFMDDIN